MHCSDYRANGISQLQHSTFLTFFFFKCCWSKQNKKKSTEKSSLVVFFFFHLNLKMKLPSLSPHFHLYHDVVCSSFSSLCNLLFEHITGQYTVMQYSLKMVRMLDSISTLQISTSPIICPILFIITSSRLFSPH